MMKSYARESEIQAVLFECCPLYKHIGLTVESAQGGHYRRRLPLDAKNTNHINTVHAALQWAAAEVVGGLVVFATFDWLSSLAYTWR
jgi:acyl-coenzyme A thioesterase PaaI-like protein